MTSDLLLDAFRWGASDHNEGMEHATREFFATDAEWRAYQNGWDADAVEQEDFSLKEHCGDE